MTELELYKFLNDNNIEHHWEKSVNNEDEFLVWIPFLLLDEFTELIGTNYLSEGGTDVNLQKDCVCLDIVDIAEYHEIELENILKKEGI